MMVLLLFSGTALAYGPGPPPSSTTTTSTTIVVAPPTTTTPTTAPTTTTVAVAQAGLAFTGTDVLESVAVALVLIGLGALLRVASRRRVN
jgi:hypothetical protein